MLLSDLRLRFARDLIGHWLDIRGGALVPIEECIDPRALLRCFDHIGIIDLTRPGQLDIELAGALWSRRFGRDIRRLNWRDLVPARLGEAGELARQRLRSVPCGFYHKFAAAAEGAAAMTAEAVILPLRRRVAARPHAAIGITREFGGGNGDAAAGWLTPAARVEHYYSDLIDIGAGVPAD